MTREFGRRACLRALVDVGVGHCEDGGFRLFAKHHQNSELVRVERRGRLAHERDDRAIIRVGVVAVAHEARERDAGVAPVVREATCEALNASCGELNLDAEQFHEILG